MFKQTLKALRIVFGDRLFLVLAVSLAANLLGLEYFIFSRSTTWEVFLASNTAFYNWTSIALTAANSVFFGVALAMVIFVLRRRMVGAFSGGGNGLLGGAFGVVSSGCPVCGAWLLPALGIAGSLTAFPFQGLEVKSLSILLLSFSINESAKSIAGVCEVPSVLVRLKPLALAGLAVLLVYALPHLPPQYKLSFARASGADTVLPAASSAADAKTLISKVNPEEGYTIGAKFGDLGPKVLESGAIDLSKFKPLTDEYQKILTQGSNETITINRKNSYFLLNFFWALGLANKNPILEEGAMAKYGEGQIGSFASTGGWTLGKTKTTDFYSSAEIIKLTSKQQARVEEVADGVFRPCCGNPTSFPDCNHGMALLAVLELLAANNASTDELYEAAKYFNAFWFPQQYLDLAVYFKAKEGKEFKDVDAKTIVSADYSSAQGWSKTKQWLAANNLVEKAPGGGGGCGV